MSFFGTVLAVLAKDLAVELRGKEIVLTTALFALLVVLLSAFAFDLDGVTGAETGAGVLWIAIAFSGLIALGRTFLREREMGVWRAVLMTPAPRGALYLGKVLGVIAFLTAAELILLPAVAIFFQTPIFENLHRLLPILLLGTTGYAAAGTLFGAMTVRTRLRDILLGTILYPLTAPILIAAVMATRTVLSGEGMAAARDYIELLVIIDAIYLTGGLWLFGPLMED
jgi:heme exporter protein B